MSEYRFDRKQAATGISRLVETGYTGNGIIMGPNRSGSHLIQIAWLQARNEGLRRRRLEAVRDEFGPYVATILYDRSGREIRRYATMRSTGMRASGMRAMHHVVTTSDKTDLAARHLAQRYELEATPALNPEDDAPLFTPRVTGVLSVPTTDRKNRSQEVIYRFAGKRNNAPLLAPYQSSPIAGTVDANLAPGVGLCAQQYQGFNETGEQPVVFEGLPYAVPIYDDTQETVPPGDDAEEIATYYADKVFNPEYFVSIVARAINVTSRRPEAPFTLNRAF